LGIIDSRAQPPSGIFPEATLFQHYGYGGATTLVKIVPPTQCVDLEPFWQANLSALKIKGKFCVDLFKGAGCQGESLSVCTENAGLGGGFNDNVKSIGRGKPVSSDSD